MNLSRSRLASTAKAWLNLVAVVVFLVPLCWSIGAAADGPYDYGFDVDRHLADRRGLQSGPAAAPAPFVVHGAPGGLHTTIAARPEIRQLETNPDLWTLYLLGLSMMQYTDQSQLLSYYQIAGIHGVPWVEWNGVAATPGNENTGYCTHVSELFLTWHRAYLALYEQVLYSLIQYIASLYPDETTRRRYQTAAAAFRIPYMDWAARPPAGESVLPGSVGGSPFVDVSGPNGVQRIANPLYSYLFKPLNSTMFIEPPYDLWLTTVRAPTAPDASAGSNNTLVSLVLDRNRPSIQQRLYNLFANYHNYSTFGNEAWIPAVSSSSSPDNAFDSLESLHDTIHTLVGLQGHMTWIPFSAFDPVFFLHHCMVDRIFALWQILNPASWVQPTAAALNSFTTSIGQMQDAQTPLTPFFRDSNGTFWTSDAVRDMGVFGYTYDDMTDFPLSSLTVANATTQAQVKALINELYGAFSPASSGVVASRESSSSKNAAGQPSTETSSSVRASPPTPEGLGVDPQKRPPRSVVVHEPSYWEWVVNIHAEKQALGGSFFVHLFLGAPPTDTSTWAYAANLVGTMSVFASPAGAPAGMVPRSNGHTAGTVPLTSALAQKMAEGELADLSPSVVEPYLRTQLHYGLITTNGTVMVPAETAGLGITVGSAAVQMPSSTEELPRWGDVEASFSLI
ncbi:putative domain, di-copper centre [Niveomyces insectorum RCEF 264]|uniref:Putative domain, di-copper centre n=1 Tax=Niveomyces insectorum RCEF 264 TaxID=1081102 RepID=A0A162KDQ5_9HYPO|nr:putative domain, di-copper centre [Niveomyces insectorum RCEF 264]